MNTLFAAGDVVLRVGRPTADPMAPIWLAGVLGEHGIRTPRYVRSEPHVDGSLAVWAIERIEPVGPIDWSEVGGMVARVHRVDPVPVDGRYPAPWCSSFPWWQFGEVLPTVVDLLDDEARTAIEAALARTGGWRTLVERVVLCHGDVHPGNVMHGHDGPVLLDWDLLCVGPPAWDHAPLMTWTERWGGEPGIYERFAEGYGESMRGDEVAEALALLRLVAATLMRVRAARINPAAWNEAERRLRWWRGDPAAPAWQAV
ncbi:MAG: aminoglycoside phosphotransferase family protein [Actinobacteria bacterium]|nr:aminoglycoside phosphotransferase family protein [Actinomycetota bacterium]